MWKLINYEQYYYNIYRYFFIPIIENLSLFWYSLIMNSDIKFFINDKYKILKILKDLEQNKKCSISQNKLTEITGFSKFKINMIINELIDNGYLKYLGRKSYSLTDKAEKIFEILESS